MGKKLTTALISILTTASIIAPPTFAEEAKDYWTYDEMSAFSKVFQSELEAECEGQDEWCKEMYLYQSYERGDKYEALLNYEAVPMIISSVNPSKKTLSVIYRDDFLMDSFHNITNEAYVKDLFIIRYDISQKDIAFEREIKNGTIGDKVHLEVVEFESKNGERWLPNNTEVTFQMQDGLFDETMINKFWYYFSTSRGNWGHLADVRSCIDEITGKDNYECRLVYRADNVAYIPQEAKTESIPPTPKDPENMQRIDEQIMQDIMNDLYGKESEEPEPEEPTPEPEPTSEPEIITPVPAPVQTQGKLPTPTTAITITAPDTGVPTNDKNRTVEMPWWVVALIISGGLLLVWWFLPTKFTKTRKKSKKVEKRS